MTEMLDEVLKLLGEVDYRVQVKGYGDGILVKIPPNRFLTDMTDHVVAAFQVVRGETPGIQTSFENSEDCFTPVEEFAIRPTLICSLRRACNDIGFPPCLIEFTREDDSVVFGVPDVIEASSNLTILERELSLIKLLDRAFEGGFTDELDQEATTLDMFREFAVCKAICLGDDHAS